MANSYSSIATIFFFAVLLTGANSAEEFSFNFPTFVPSQNNLILQGDAVINSAGKLRLTTVDSNDLPTYSSVGRAIYSAPIRLYDSDTGNVASWATSFTFNVTAPSKSTTANGLAFFLTYPNSEPKSGGGYLGLFDSKTYNKEAQTVAVEFDTYVDSDWDPSNRHIGIDVNSIKSIKTASWGLANGQVARILVTYDPSTTLLVASLIHPSRRTSYILSEKVNLKSVLPEWVSVGFSATTGDSESYVETHDILSWSFASKLSSDSSDGVDLASFMLHEAV